MIKLTVNSKELNDIIKFIANISSKYAVDQNATSVKVVATKKKKKIIFAAHGTYLEVDAPSIVAEKEGEFVVDAFFLEKLPSRAKETNIEVEKDEEGSYRLKFANGKAKGDLVIANDIDNFNKQVMDSSEFPSKFITLSSKQIANTVNKVLFNSTDTELDKKIGLPIKIISKGKEVTIYSGDRNSALIYKLELKEKAEKCEILTQGSLIKDTFAFTSEFLNFASNETVTRLKSSNFDLVVPTQELELFNLEDWFSQHSKKVSEITFKMSDLTAALEDTQIISDIANITSRFNMVFKDNKVTITNKANVGKAKAVFKASGSKEFNLYSYSEWFKNIEKNFGDSEVKMMIMPSVAIIKNKDESITAIIPMME